MNFKQLIENDINFVYTLDKKVIKVYIKHDKPQKGKIGKLELIAKDNIFSANHKRVATVLITNYLKKNKNLKNNNITIKEL